MENTLIKVLTMTFTSEQSITDGSDMFTLAVKTGTLSMKITADILA